MNSCSEDVKDMIEAVSALGLAFATDLFIAREPTTPKDCVTIFDTPGAPPDIALDKSEYYYPSIQVRVRNTDYTVGWALANDIMIELHGQVQETWNGTLYTVIKATSGPALLGWDENNRAIIVVNFDIQRR